MNSNRRPRGGGRSNSGNNRSGSSSGRHGSNNNRRSNGGNRSYDSNGPDGKIRGSATQVYEKYTSLAVDASTSGDYVGAENFYQHAEHYLRIMLANNLVKSEKTSEQSAGEENDTDSSDDKSESLENTKDNSENQKPSSKVKNLKDEDEGVSDSEAEEPIILDLSQPETNDDAADEKDGPVDNTPSEDEPSEEEKPKTKRRVSRTRGLRRRTSRRSDETSESDEPQTTE